MSGEGPKKNTPDTKQKTKQQNQKPPVKEDKKPPKKVKRIKTHPGYPRIHQDNREKE